MHHKIISVSLLSLPPLLIESTAQAAIQHPLNDLKVIEASISKQALTRIAVKHDRILNVFGSAGDYVLEADEDQGQIFIQPSGFNDFKPIHLTLTTEGGHTQDLRLIPQDQAPETLILKAEDKELTEKLSQPIARHEVEDLLRACQEKRIPLGYKLVPLDVRVYPPNTSLQGNPGPGLNPEDRGPKTSSRPYPSPELIQGDQELSINPKAFIDHYFLKREIKGDKLRGLTYAVKNTYKAPLILSEPEFAESLPLEKTDVIAILMPNKTLAPGERIEVHVVAYSH